MCCGHVDFNVSDSVCKHEVDFLAGWDKIPVFSRWFYPVANVTLNTLNVVWLYKILDALARRFRPQPVKKD